MAIQNARCLAKNKIMINDQGEGGRLAKFIGFSNLAPRRGGAHVVEHCFMGGLHKLPIRCSGPDVVTGQGSTELSAQAVNFLMDFVRA